MSRSTPLSMLRSICMASALASIVSCADDTQNADRNAQNIGDDAHHDGSGLGSVDQAVWFGGVDHVINAHCASCHTDGGSAPFALDSAEDWETWGMASMNAIDEGRMPPFPADTDCRDYANDRNMPSADRELVRAWLDGDRPLGDADNAAPAFALEPFDADVALPIPSPFTPNFDRPDEYRCFLLDYDVTETTFVAGTNVVPGSPLVHHVLAYALTGSDLEVARTLDAEESGPGYTCFGGPVPNGFADEDTGASIAERIGAVGQFPQQIGAWVPGQQPNIAQPGVAMMLEPGSQLVVQIHYSAVAGDVTADAGTELQLLLADEPPTLVRNTRPIPVRPLEIPAGDSEAVNQALVPFYGTSPTVIRSLTGHMHLLGTQLQADVVRADDARECALSIPDWDFDWQQSYELPQDRWIELHNGDAIELTCVYDNSAANQPVVNGAQIEPRDVAWGEGTLDEMCLLYLDMVEPYVEEDSSAACPLSCTDTCGTDDPACLLACAGTDFECVGCLIEGILDCGGQACLAPLASDQRCFAQCASSSIILGGDLDACMSANCGEAYGEFVGCAEELMASPECVREVVGCASAR